MRLLWFNLATDADDPILGFTTSWIRAVAERVEFIRVITMRAGRVEVPENVRIYSVGKERGYGEPRRAIEFYRHLFHILREDRIDICFSHMIPIFSVLGAPILKAWGIPIVTWYAHRQITNTLKLAHYLSTRMVSVNAGSYPYVKEKLVPLGHGIDTALFSPAPEATEDSYLVLSVGRLSPIKDLGTLLRAVALLRQQGIPVRSDLVGVPPARDRSYTAELRAMVNDLGLSEFVRFIGPLRHREVAAWYRRCMVHVNCAPQDHSIDKAPLEAMACGVPSLASAEAYRETLGRYAEALLFREGDAEDLAARLVSLSATERSEMRAYLREQVMKEHSLDRLGDGLVKLLCELCS